MTAKTNAKPVDRARVFNMPSPEAIEQYYAGMRPFWHPVLAAADLPSDRPVGIELLGEKIALARLDNHIVAMQDLCRHFQSQLSLGEIRQTPDGTQCLMCKYHGWHYNAEGKCAYIPQLLPGREIPKEARVPTYLTAERYDLIWVCSEEEPTYAIPEFPELSDSRFRPGPLRIYDPW